MVNLVFILKRNLLTPGDIRSRNNYPRTVQKSPASNIDTIEEEEDEEHVSKLLVIIIIGFIYMSNFGFFFVEWKNINTIINTNDSK